MTLTEEEAARLAKCCVLTLRKRFANRQLAAAKIGRSWVIPEQAFMESLNKLAQMPAPVAVSKGRRRALAKV